MTNSGQIHDILRMLNKENFFFEATILKFIDLLNVWKLATKIKFKHNLSISPKFCKIGIKTLVFLSILFVHL